MSSRRNRFRACMARFDAAADPAEAISRGLHVRRSGQAADRIASRLELRSTSSVLLLGGIGAGKTTQLLIARHRLAEAEDITAIFLDLSRHQDLSKLQVGSLMALAGVAMAEMNPLPECVDYHKVLAAKFRLWAKGEWAYPTFEEEPDGHWEPGVVTPPALSIDPNLRTRIDDLRAIKEQVLKPDQSLVLLIDSLDRVTDLNAFATVVMQDVAAIASTGIGLVVVGPTRALYGLNREIAERFEPIVFMSDIDIANDYEGVAFLDEVLEKRASNDLMDATARRLLVMLSGGVLRDLIHLGRLALIEAYDDGADSISAQHVGRAADGFGRTRMLGLSNSDLNILQHVRTTGSFVQTTELELALLSTRRIIEYRAPAPRYVVHPTIEPLLKQLPS